MIDLRHENDVFVLSMNDGENRINARFVDGFSSALDEVERHNGNCSLVTTGAFAAGAMLVLAHDSSVMRTDRGYYCLPEVDLGTAFPPGLMALIRARLPQPVLHEACTTGKRYGAGDALARGIIGEAAAESEVLPRAIALARELAGKGGGTLAAIKRGLYASALSVLEQS